MNELLRVENLCVGYKDRMVVRDLSFSLSAGETLGVVGPSGCGKTTLSRAILGLEPIRGGEIFFEGTPLRKRTKLLRRAIQVVFQDPFASLNPRHTVLDLITEGMLVHGLATRRTRRARAAELLADVGLGAEALDRYPHAFSGGQRQRIAIARAIALEPKLLICDEAVSALDPSVRAQILNLLAELKERRGLSYLFITHDIGVVRHIADRVAVMDGGKFSELAPPEELFGKPATMLSQRLIAAADF